MNIADYLSCGGRGAARSLATAIGAHAPDVSRWVSGGRPVPPAHCVAIERVTNGAVRRWELRPDDWHRLWPELIGSDGAPEAPKAPEPTTQQAEPAGQQAD